MGKVGVDMDGFGQFATDLEFVERLISEESVFCLPGTCFGSHNYVRVVLTVPKETLREACARISTFCTRHYHPQTITNGISNANVTNGHINGGTHEMCNGGNHEHPMKEEVDVLAAKVNAIENVSSLVSETERLTKGRCVVCGGGSL
ncbi:Tyrosine aminotransferase-like [Homarus americanus]|uniref:Tyrosine aminotransferase-like n=1 Tax=Homarus americanus TaxID=6706 RepID=A0A8J5N659_HOMAM|nr:Tyrosine aminotransferase-like [Homarus americanus]